MRAIPALLTSLNRSRQGSWASYACDIWRLFPAPCHRPPQILTEERGQLATAEQVELLIQSLGDESLSVRATALQVNARQGLQYANSCLFGHASLLFATGAHSLVQSPCARHMRCCCILMQELKSVLSSRRDWVSRMLTGGGGKGDGPQLLSRLMSALLKCCDPEVRLPAGCSMLGMAHVSEHTCEPNLVEFDSLRAHSC